MHPNKANFSGALNWADSTRGEHSPTASNVRGSPQIQSKRRHTNQSVQWGTEMQGSTKSNPLTTCKARHTQGQQDPKKANFSGALNWAGLALTELALFAKTLQ